MKEKNEHVIKVCFDMQQNQPIPKLSVGEVFYARQIWLYNLTFVRHDQTVQNKDNIIIYTWLGTQSGRGSNEVSSALVHYLSKLEKDLITERGAKVQLDIYFLLVHCRIKTWLFCVV